METSRTKAHDALNLPEIRSLIGLFLVGHNGDIISCMMVNKSWRADFRRILYLNLVLTRRTMGPIILPLQWRAYGPYTQSLFIEEPTVAHRDNKRTKTYGSSIGASQSNKVKTSLRSSDYNLDPALHCPNLLHLTVRLSPKLLPLCCWTRQEDAWYEVGEDGNLAGDDQHQHQQSMFKTSAVVRYDRQQESYIVRTSNRILAMLHFHPKLQTFRWIGSSETHMDQIGRYLLTRQHQFVELQLEHLKASVSELNTIINNCTRLRRLDLKTLALRAAPNWTDVSTSTANELAPFLMSQFAALFSLPLATSPTDSDLQVIPRQQQAILDLQGIESLKLEEPHFPMLQLCIHGPALKRLCLSDCQFPTGFNNAVGTSSNHQQTDPTMSTPSVPSAPEFGVYWNCPYLETYQHNQTNVLSSVFVNNLLDSSRKTLSSLSLVSYTMDSDFVTGLIDRDQCRVLTYLNLSMSTWIKSTEIQLLLCHCTELIEFIGPQGVLWGEDLALSPLSWTCVKLRRLQLLICLARPDSGIWEQSMKKGRSEGPLSFPLQGILGSRFAFPQIAAALQEASGQTGAVGTGVGSDEAGEIVEPVSETLMRLEDIQNAVYDQLSRLTQLEFLDLTGGGNTSFHFLVEYPRGIPWTLDAGLDKLQGLGRMRELVVTGWEEKMTRQEARWLKQHWPELRKIVDKSGDLAQGGTTLGGGDDEDRKPDEDRVVGWLAFEICLAQEWPERFPGAIGLVTGG
ncbi:hypothetical protein BC939DRAFT_447869 [Gamsiella multidivaricata]|uniref:uncharacterized protein n=1 Tax=Gamsiella multidivaricata TaxID=101098 RepID=UPI00221ED225|nr:uncharacterized protein BC939DRAFT_447869 [Gamsiella multidivaricata]KAI7825619.1 hypothetical protein BC939DRAFT_447869 [Gamsiella multidivaricata]